MARFQNYSKLEEHSEESSVSSLHFSPSEHQASGSEALAPRDDLDLEDGKHSVNDLLGSLSEDPGKTQHLSRQMKSTECKPTSVQDIFNFSIHK